MRTVSAEFLEISQRSEFHYLEYIVLDGQRIQISGKLMDDSYLDGNFIGTFIFKRLEFECEYHDFRNKEVSYHKAIRHQGEWQTVDFGNFIVTELEVSDTFDTVKVIAYDYGLKFASPYESALTYPTTLQAVLNEACEQVGMVAPTLDINGAFVVENNQFPEQQTRYVISAIAQITGNIAHIKGNQLVFVLNTPTGLVLDEYEELQDKRDTRPITIVSMGLSQVEGENITLRWEEGIAQYGENYLILNDNPFTYTQSKREEAITAVFNKMKGFSYSSFVIKNGFYPHLEIGDKVQFKTTNGSLVDSIVLRYEQAESVINLEAPSIIKATVDYQNPPSLELALKQTQIIVDKSAGEITLINNNLNNNYYDKAGTQEQIQIVQGQILQQVSELGGDNLIDNSVGQIGFGDATVTGSVSSISDESLLTNTDSKRGIKVDNGSFKRSLRLIDGKEYTFACMVRKTTNNATIKLKNTVETILLQTDEPIQWELFSHTFVQTGATFEWEFISDDIELVVADIVLRKGTSTAYSQSANEIYNSSMTLTKQGATFNTGLDTVAKIDGAGLRVVNTKNNDIVFKGVADGLLAKNGEFYGGLLKVGSQTIKGIQNVLKFNIGG